MSPSRFFPSDECRLTVGSVCCLALRKAASARGRGRTSGPAAGLSRTWRPIRRRVCIGKIFEAPSQRRCVEQSLEHLEQDSVRLVIVQQTCVRDGRPQNCHWIIDLAKVVRSHNPQIWSCRVSSVSTKLVGDIVLGDRMFTVALPTSVKMHSDWLQLNGTVHATARAAGQSHMSELHWYHNAMTSETIDHRSKWDPLY